MILLLRFGCGLSTATLATMFHLPRATMAARLTRGKQRLQAAVRAERVVDPDVGSLLPVIIQAIYLTFTAGMNPATGTERTDPDRLLHAEFRSEAVFRRWPGTDTAALRIMIMLAADRSPNAFQQARRLTRHLAEVTPLSTQAAIALEHAVGRAVAIGHAFEPATGLADLDELARFPGLSTYRYLHAARGASCLSSVEARRPPVPTHGPPASVPTRRRAPSSADGSVSRFNPADDAGNGFAAAAR